MASLNTMRTKFGVLLSAIIAIALLAFVLSLKTELGFSNGDPKVGEINGEKVTYTEFLEAYNTVKAQMGGDEAYSDEQAQRILGGAWQQIMAEHVLLPGLEDLGLEVTAAEHAKMLKGEVPSNIYASFFRDPKTGMMDPSAVTAYLEQVKANPQLQASWKFVSSQALLDRNMNKYIDLVRNGAYSTKLEVENFAKTDGKTYKGSFVAVKYSTIADSLVTISKSEEKAYYESHKNLYKQNPYRSISFVVFDVDATDEDKAAIEADAKATAEELAATTDYKTLSRNNRHVALAQTYISESNLSNDELAAFKAGKVYGPELKNGEWKASKAIDARVVAEKIGLKHIVLGYMDEAKADSLLTVAKKGEVPFEKLAEENSLAETANIGTVDYSSLVPEFANAFVGAKVGDLVKVAYGNTIQIFQVTELGAAKKHYLLANMTYTEEASQATTRQAHNTASLFSVNAKLPVSAWNVKGWFSSLAAEKIEKFNAVASEQALSTRSANIERGARSIRGISDNAIEVIRWAQDAKVGDVSEIFKVGKDYVVAVLTGVNDSEFKTLPEVALQVRSALLHDKKFAEISKKMQGATLEEIAANAESKVETFEDAKYTAYYVKGLGVEPKVLGAIAATEVNTISAPVKGSQGVYVVKVEEVVDPAEPASYDDQKIKVQSNATDMAAPRAMNAVQDLANVKDETPKFF